MSHFVVFSWPPHLSLLLKALKNANLKRYSIKPKSFLFTTTKPYYRRFKALGMNSWISLKALINYLIALKFILSNSFQGSEKLYQAKKMRLIRVFYTTCRRLQCSRTVFKNFKNQSQRFMTIFRNFKNQSAFYNHI